MIRRLAELMSNIVIFMGVTSKCASILSNAKKTDTGNEINTFKNLQLNEMK